MSLSTLLNDAINIRSGLNSQDPDWYQFVLDHLDYITERSNIFEIDAVTMNQYRYDLKRYLKVDKTRHEDIAWVVQLLNDLPSDLSFDTPGKFIIPTDKIMKDLYHSYKAITANP